MVINIFILNNCDLNIFMFSDTDFAFKKPAKQSSTTPQVPGTNTTYRAINAVSRKESLINCRTTNTMSKTEQEEEPWWKVDLQGNFSVMYVEIMSPFEHKGFLYDIHYDRENRKFTCTLKSSPAVL